MYDRLFCPHQHSEMYGYSKLYLDQMFERNMRPLKDTNACMSVERGVCVCWGGGGGGGDLLLQILGLFASCDPVSVFGDSVMMFVT